MITVMLIAFGMHTKEIMEAINHVWRMIWTRS